MGRYETDSCYYLEVFDISMGTSRRELVEVAWRGDDYDRGEEEFEEETERVAVLVNKRQVEKGSTLVLLRQFDGTEERKEIV